MFSTDTHSMVIDHQADTLDHATEPHSAAMVVAGDRGLGGQCRPSVTSPMTEEEPTLFSRWERDTRYYELRLQQDLWGFWVLTRVWGRKQSALGQLRREPFDSHIQGLAQLIKEEKRRQGRGYVKTGTVAG